MMRIKIAIPRTLAIIPRWTSVIMIKLREDKVKLKIKVKIHRRKGRKNECTRC